MDHRGGPAGGTPLTQEAPHCIFTGQCWCSDSISRTFHATILNLEPLLFQTTMRNVKKWVMLTNILQESSSDKQSLLTKVPGNIYLKNQTRKLPVRRSKVKPVSGKWKFSPESIQLKSDIWGEKANYMKDSEATLWFRHSWTFFFPTLAKRCLASFNNWRVGSSKSCSCLWSLCQRCYRNKAVQLFIV